MKKNILFLIGGAIVGITMTLVVAYKLPTPEMFEEDYDDFFSLDGCK